jgi:hypothetical protein
VLVRSLEGVDRYKCLTCAGAAPVLVQFVLVQLSPGKHEAQLPPPEAAVDHLERVDSNLRGSIGVASVEVRRAVVIEVHRDHDPEEAADCRHGQMFPLEAAERGSGSAGRTRLP